jgi:DeoR/GlpR family transcriptional regulator of sugar metabolism
MSNELLQKERQARIRDILARHGKVLAGDLAGLFAVSEDTIRRDLRDMANNGECERVYGGALSIKPASLPMAARLAMAPDRKTALAATAAALVAPRMTLFLDTGSTNLAIARTLAQDLGLTVITNAPDIALALADRDGIAVIMIGGSFDRHSRANFGARACRDLDGFNPDMTILGACAVDPVQGVTATHFEDAEIKRLAVCRSGAVLVAATNEKLGASGTHRICAPQRITHLVVEADIDPALAAPFATLGVAVHKAAGPKKGWT